MKHRPRIEEQEDLLRPRLVDLIDPRHELVKLAGMIDWEVFEREWSGFFPSHRGRLATPPRVVAGLLYLQHAWRLSDEAVVARWVENPCYQHFTGEVFFQHRPPIDPSSLTRWRKRIGEEGVEWLLTQTIRAGQTSGAIDQNSLKYIHTDLIASHRSTINVDILTNAARPDAQFEAMIAAMGPEMSLGAGAQAKHDEFSYRIVTHPERGIGVVFTQYHGGMAFISVLNNNKSSKLSRRGLAFRFGTNAQEGYTF